MPTQSFCKFLLTILFSNDNQKWRLDDTMSPMFGDGFQSYIDKILAAESSPVRLKLPLTISEWDLWTKNLSADSPAAINF